MKNHKESRSNWIEFREKIIGQGLKFQFFQLSGFYFRVNVQLRSHGFVSLTVKNKCERVEESFFFHTICCEGRSSVVKLRVDWGFFGGLLELIWGLIAWHFRYQNLSATISVKLSMKSPASSTRPQDSKHHQDSREKPSTANTPSRLARNLPLSQKKNLIQSNQEIQSSKSAKKSQIHWKSSFIHKLWKKVIKP